MLVTNASGTAVAKSNYLPFGGARLVTGTFDTDKRFTGQTLDESGLYYYNARYYDATIGRFISADTFVQDSYDPQSLNRYTYVLNNPLKYTDPTGHFLDTLFDIGSVIWDIVDIVKNPTSGWAWASLGADVVCAVVPFVSGGGLAVRGVKIGTKAVNAIDNASDAVKAADRAHDYARTIDKAWDVTKVVDNTHDYAKTVDKAWSVGGRTKSSPAFGQRMHKAYRSNQLDYLRRKELVFKSTGHRVDFVDFEKGIIYELKPNNPRAIAQGRRQLAVYLSDAQKLRPDISWKTVLDLY